MIPFEKNGGYNDLPKRVVDALKDDNTHMEKDVLSWYKYLVEQPSKLINQKSFFDKIERLDVKALYEKYCGAVSKDFNDANLKALSIKDALIGNRESNGQPDMGLIHNYIDSQFDLWRENFMKNVRNDWGNLSVDQKESINNFINTAKNINFKDGFDENKPYLNIIRLSEFEDLFTDFKAKTDYFQKFNLNITAQGNGISYLHVSSLKKPEHDVTSRLYLNVKPENRMALTTLVKTQCEEQGISFYGKFSIENSKRNDNFLIYTNEFDIESILAILENVKSKNPEVFDSCEEKAPIWTKINGYDYVGYGEEPHELLKNDKKIKTSYSAIREKVFSDCFQIMGKDFNEEIFSQVCKAYGVSPVNFAVNLDTNKFCNDQFYGDRLKTLDNCIRKVQFEVDNKYSFLQQIRNDYLSHRTNIVSEIQKCELNNGRSM